ncbi:glutathione S-transferase family protein [Oceanicola sp. 502str15]|uniref:glutathione S-transferase family protein n=1 Tax=Oceanicola sp. 502str15 TaxID=2696061 RepID=UPI0020954DEE|nr:glutathione S-transferase family protein [Oceanicola sp. 502str15]
MSAGRTPMLKLYGHPFASFCWKALIALYEREVPFDFLMVDPEHPDNAAFVAQAAPTGQFPVLVDGARVVIESAPIIEYLDLHHGAAAPLVPADPRAAIEARQMDGVFDDYVMAPLTRMVLNRIRGAAHDPLADEEAQAVLDKAYAWLDLWMAERDWAACGRFTLADVAAGPALHYAHWGHPIAARHTALLAYRARLMAHPSIARVVDEARPMRWMFPLKDNGSPD